MDPVTRRDRRVLEPRFRNREPDDWNERSIDLLPTFNVYELRVSYRSFPPFEFLLGWVFLRIFFFFFMPMSFAPTFVRRKIRFEKIELDITI